MIIIIIIIILLFAARNRVEGVERTYFRVDTSSVRFFSSWSMPRLPPGLAEKVDERGEGGLRRFFFFLPQNVGSLFSIQTQSSLARVGISIVHHQRNNRDKKGSLDQRGRGWGPPPPKKNPMFFNPKEGGGGEPATTVDWKKKVGEGDPKQNYDKCMH